VRLPGFVNAHSHAFQRRLRGAVERVDPAHPHDDFWTWREAMYAEAGRLDPDSAFEVALLAYREMRAAGYVAVGEFHYPHHRPDGTPYDPPNAMAEATIAAAAEAGIEIVLLMTAYERAGAGLPPTPGQRRFCDPDVDAYLRRVEDLAAAHPGRVGLAPHSVRACSRGWLEAIARYAAETGMVVHTHACEQRREIEECLAEHGRRPIELLADTGLLAERTTVVHATHASDAELDLMAEAGAAICACSRMSRIIKPTSASRASFGTSVQSGALTTRRIANKSICWASELCSRRAPIAVAIVFRAMSLSPILVARNSRCVPKLGIR